MSVNGILGYTIIISDGTTEVRIPTVDERGRPIMKTLTFAGKPISES